MDITLIIPLDEGTVDYDCRISAGIRVYCGHLTLEQIAAATNEPYPQRAAQAIYDTSGKLTSVYVTFSNDETPGPQAALVGSGSVFTNDNNGDDDDGVNVGQLSYEVRFSTMETTIV